MKPFAASTTFLLLSVLAAIGQAAATTVKLSVGQSIQEAIDSLPNDGSKAVIEVESGTYNENITIARPYIIFRASGSGPVVLQESVENYAVVYIDYDSSDISFYDFEIINTIGEAAGNQNAFRSYSDRIALYNCKIIGYGDTAWFSVGSVYVYNSWIEGTVDYAYGQADVYFYKSTLANNGLGSVSAPSTLDSDPKGGFVFMNANFTPVISSIYDKRQENAHSYSKPLSESEFKNSVILSRPWHNSPKNIILKSTISSHIKSAGYDAWNFSEDELESKVFYAEYENTGAGADTSQRVSWLKALTADEAAPYLSPSNFFGNLGLGTSWIDSNYLS